LKNIRFLSLAALLGAGFSSAAIACDSCALYLADGADRPGFSLAVAHQFTRLGSVWQGDRQRGNPVDQYLDSSITQWTLGWSRGGPWHVQLTVPYISRSYVRPEHAEIERGRVRGLGDATLAARWQVARHVTSRGDTLEFNVLGDVEFGTGDADRLGDEVGHHFHHHTGFPDSGIHGHDLALGSGSTDGLLGADARWQRGRGFVRGALQYKLRRPGAFDYRMADETSWETGLGYHAVLTHAHSLALQALFSAEHKGLDSLAGERQVDTGISTRYVGVRASGTIGQRFSAEAGLEIPVRIRTSELMVVPDYRVRVAAAWRF